MSMEATGHGDRALALHQAGNLAEAVILYEQAIAETTTPSAVMLHFAGMAYFALDRPKKAEAYLARAAAGSMRADFHFAHGNALYRLGRHAKAIAAFQRAVELDPANAAIWFNLGNAAEAAKKPALAAEAFQKALDFDPLMTQALANLANNLVATEQFELFARLVTQVRSLSIWREYFTGVALIGVATALGNTVENKTQPLLDALIALSRKYPDDPEVSWVLGSLHLMRREFDAAEHCLETTIALDSANTRAKRSLGVLLAGKGEMARAGDLLKEVVDEDPDALHLIRLINLYISLSGKSAASIGAYKAAALAYPWDKVIFDTHLSWLLISDDPDCIPDAVDLLEQWLDHEETAMTHVNLGATLQRLKQNTKAVRHLRRAIELDKRNFQAWHNLSNIQLDQNRVAEAYDSARKAARLEPSSLDVAINVSIAAGRLGKTDEAERALLRGLKYHPGSPELLNLLGNTKIRRGDMKAGLAYFKKARAHVEAGKDKGLFAMQLMAVNYSAEVPPRIVSDMHFRWGDTLVAYMANHHKSAEPPHEMKTRLKVGYVSGDYRNHSCAYFLKPLIDNLDPERIEVFCYMTESASDEITVQFRQSVPHWREIHGLTDPEVFDLIRKDGIDILMDLSGHTSGGRLALFAMKAAPLQVTWLGYPNTTGLPTMDYRFTDDLADPISPDNDRLYREQLYRLPHFLCYEPPEYTPPVGSLPALHNGRVTFGCFNNSNKITDEVVAAWASIMRRVPDSHIVLKTSNLSDQLTLDAFRKKFAKNGVTASQVECFPSFPSKYDHLMTYGEIDLALDPFPYNGTTTSFESLWMGVPMVTLEGTVHAGRVGHAIMTAAGLGELVGRSVEDYIEIAVALAGDLDRLASYRAKTRQLLQSSPLMDGKSFAASVETAYFNMWRHAVAQGKSRKSAL